MTATMTPPPEAPQAPEAAPDRSSSTPPAQKLQQTMAAVRLSVRWLGVRRSLEPHQRAQAAQTFGAEDQYLSAAKKLLDTSHTAYRAVTTIRNQAVGYWRGMSLPFPEPGVRLLRQDQVDDFEAQMRRFTGELDEAVAELDRHYGELKLDARRRLGDLFHEGDYPPTLRGLFALTWDYPAVEPPRYLLNLNAKLYEQEQQRIAARFEQAVELAEQAFGAELQKLVAHLADRLSGAEDGKPRVFRDSAVENLREFFDRFSNLSIRSNAELENLVATARRTLGDVEPDQLRRSGSLRQQIAQRMEKVAGALDQLMVQRPRRSIIRRGRAE